MKFFESKRVVRATDSGLTPNVAITIAVDIAYVASHGGANINKGVYMMDNMLAQGSSSEAQMELHTRCQVGQLIGFNAVPINNYSPTKGSVAITGFTVSQGSVFTSQGQPVEQTPSYWIGQAMRAGTQTYQVQLKVTTGGLNPTSYYVNWDPFITAS